MVFGNWRWYSETRIRKLEVVFGNWKVVFRNWTIHWYSETRTWYLETGSNIRKLGSTIRKLRMRIRKLKLYSETYIIGNWNPGIKNPRNTTTERWFDFFHPPSSSTVIPLLEQRKGYRSEDNFKWRSFSIYWPEGGGNFDPVKILLNILAERAAILIPYKDNLKLRSGSIYWQEEGAVLIPSQNKFRLLCPYRCCFEFWSLIKISWK